MKIKNKEYSTVLVKQLIMTKKISIIVNNTVKENKSYQRISMNRLKIILIKNYQILQFNIAHKINLKQNLIKNLKKSLKKNLRRNPIKGDQSKDQLRLIKKRNKHNLINLMIKFLILKH